MGTKIKTAWEKAMERFEEKNKQVSSKDVMRMECLEEGQKLVGRYLAEPELNLKAALTKYDPEMQHLLFKVVGETLLNRLVLPVDEQNFQNNLRVMEGLMEVKQNKQALSPLLGELKNLLSYYRKTRDQARESLEEQLSSYIEETLRQKGMRPAPGTRINPERHPKFQEEWSRLLSRINDKFMPKFNQLRQEIGKIE